MSTGHSSRQRSQSATSRQTNIKQVPQPTSTPDPDGEFQPCTATASFFLYAQRNVILCLHHDTLAIERRFARHQEDVLWICADTVSERGAGRLAVSYDAGHTAIVWDISTGDEIARFAAYEHIRVAAWMRNGNIAFGNAQGNIILFEPSTSEHISARTIYDPITAIAPAADCRTFAIGFLNGSILIATLQPLFTIVHSLTTSKAPSRISGLAWHGSSSRQKTDMLATQTADGDLRVWSIPRLPNGGDVPNIIRILTKVEDRIPGPCWFAWSKNGRITQHADGETRVWDVRTKNVTFQTVPTVEGIVGISCYGPASTLFTLGRNHTVQQYDVNPNETPLQVASVQHAPGPIPPSPPNSIEEQKQNPPVDPTIATTTVPLTFAYVESDASEGELGTMSPLEKIAREMDQLEDERRDLVGVLSPTSSRASSVSSRSSNGGRRPPSYRYDRAPSSRASNVSFNDGTEFSFGPPSRHPRESVSMHSTSSMTSSRHRSSGLRKEILRSPEEAKQMSQMDLFPNTRARLRDVAFRTPHYGHVPRTPDVLRREMLSVVFGWNDDIESLIRDELSRQRPGSASGVLLSKWLGDLEADVMASMIGSESMTSSDWMLLALSSMGPSSQKQVGQAFVQRLLEKGDVHPAVAVLLGLVEYNDAIEVYVSRGYCMEAVLLTCLIMPSDWQRQSYLVRKWGEVAVSKGQPELAVRCFSCTSIDTTEPWSSPRAQDAVFHSQKEQVLGPSPLSPPMSPPFAAGSNRKITRNGSLKLITTFGDKGAPLVLPSDQRTPLNGMLGVGVTPIAESALSPGGAAPWLRASHKVDRDPSSARTATPGAYRRKRLPSRSGTSRTRDPSQTPLTARRDFTNLTKEPEADGGRPSARPEHSRKASSISSKSIGKSSLRSLESERLPSPNNEAFSRLKDESRRRNGSRERTNGDLHVQVFDTSYLAPEASQGPLERERRQDRFFEGNVDKVNDNRDPNQAIAGPSRERYHGLGDDGRRGHSRVRDRSEARGRSNTRYIQPPRTSPSSPIPMSPDEVLASRAMVVPDDESYYRGAVPQQRDRSTTGQSVRAVSRAQSRQRSLDRADQRVQSQARGRSEQRQREESSARCPSTSLQTAIRAMLEGEEDVTRDHGLGDRSRNIPATEASHGGLEDMESYVPPRSSLDDYSSASENPEQGVLRRRDLRGLTKKQIAARELEERRASLARRPSAPAIPLPGDVQISLRKPSLPPRHHTELGDAPNSSTPPLSGASIGRSHTADPDTMGRFPPGRSTGTSTPSAPVGLPATPRAMRHPRYMSADPNERGGMRTVPDVPGGLPQLTSAVFQPTMLPGRAAEEDKMPPLLPSTVFGLKDPQSPPRSSSAPPEMSNDGLPSHPAYKATLPHSTRRGSIGRGHSRKITPTDNQIASLQPQFSPPSTRNSTDRTLHENQVIIVEEDEESIMLPELQHLAGPPPPPPPPFVTPSTSQNNGNNNLGVINIAIEEEAPMVIDVAPNLDRTGATTAPPGSNTRRGRGSISEGLGFRLRTVTERMRNTSKSRAKSPPMEGYAPSPYETVLPSMFSRHNQIRSPYESTASGVAASEADFQSQMPPPPPPPPSAPPIMQARVLVEHVVPPENGRITGGYPHPRDVKANALPPTLQQGNYEPENMI